MVQYYWLAAFQRPIKTILKIEQMMAKFLWKRGMHSISWVRICRQTKNKKKRTRTEEIVQQNSSLTDQTGS